MLARLVFLCVIVMRDAFFYYVGALVGLGVREPAEPMLVVLVHHEILFLVRVIPLGVGGIPVASFHVNVCLVAEVFVAQLAGNQHAVQTGIGREVFPCCLRVLGDPVKFVDRTCRVVLEMVHVVLLAVHDPLRAPCVL